MSNLSGKISTLPETEFPDGLHARIMRKLFFLRLRTPFVVIVSLLSTSLAVSGWRVWTRMTDLDTISILKDAVAGSEWSATYAANIFDAVSAYLPVAATLVFFINMFALTYVFYLFFKFRKMPMKGRGMSYV